LTARPQAFHLHLFPIQSASNYITFHPARARFSLCKQDIIQVAAAIADSLQPGGLRGRDR